MGLSIFATIFSGVTSVFKSIMGFKAEQANIVSQAVNTIGTVTAADADAQMAAANAIAALYVNGNWLERSWRPTFMWICMLLIVSRWFGFVPPHLPKDEIILIYNYMEMGLIGYGTLRSVDKWMKGFQIGTLLQKLIEKKVL